MGSLMINETLGLRASGQHPSSSPSCFANGDNTFGPSISHDCRSFDFTLLFEQCFLSLVPSLVLILLSPIRIVSIFRRDVKTLPNRLQSWKLICSICYAAIQLALLAIWALPSTERTRVSLATAAFSFFASVIICALSQLEHVKSIQPSALLNFYLFFSVLFDAVQLRTLWMIPGLQTPAKVFSASLAIKIALCTVEAVEKGSILASPYKWSTPEALSGIYNKSVFWWLNRLFLTGFRKVLQFDDLYHLDHDLESEAIAARTLQNWQQADKTRKHALIFAVFKTLKWQFLVAVLPRICLIGFQYSQPFLINRTIKFVGDMPSAGNDSKNIGYGLIGAAGLIYIGLAVTNGAFKHACYRCVTMLRGALISLIYQKTLDVKFSSIESAAPTTLMTADVDAILNNLESCHEVWASSIEVIISIVLLQRETGLACILPVVLALASTGLNYLVGKQMGIRRRIWNESIQQRISLTSTALQDMKAVKMMGLAPRLMDLLQAQRVRELQKMVGFRWMLVWMNLVALITSAYSPAFVLMIHSLQARASGKPPLSAAQAYTILSLLSLMTQPLGLALSSIPGLMSAMACFDRIQKYLLADGRTDDRLIEGFSREIPTTLPSGIELNVLPSKSSTRHEQDFLLLEESSFGYSSEAIVVDALTARFRVASTTMLIGEVGSGKTSILLGLLGELQSLKGFVRMKTADIGYCQQSAWLTNDIVRDIIIGPAPFEDEWYRTVIHVCGLDIDIDQFPDGDKSVIGSRGLSLSGGQRQRLALARAVYARKRLLLLDDVFSALDAKTEAMVFERLFSKAGLFRKLGTTVILTTHAVHHLKSADHIIALGKNGSILEQGAFEELEAQEGYVRSLAIKAASKQLEKEEDEQHQETSISAGKSSSTTPAASPADESNQNARRLGDLSVYNYYFKQIGWPLMLAFFFFTFCATSSSSAQSLWVEWWTSANGRHTDMYITVMVMFAFFSYTSNFTSLWVLFMKINPRAGSRLHWILSRTVFAAPFKFFTSTDSGVILNRFSQDMTIVDIQLPIGLLLVITATVQLLWNIGLMCYGSFYMAAFIPFSAITVYGIQSFYLRTSRQIRLLDLEMKSPLFAHFSETLEGLATVRAFAWEQSFLTKFYNKLDASQRPFYLLYCIQRWLNISLDMLVACLAILLVAFGTHFQASGGAIGVAMLNVLNFSQNLARLIESWTMLETSIGSVARLKQLEQDIRPEHLPTEIQSPPTTWPTAGAISFSHVSASYGEDPGAPLVLNDITLDVHSGEKIGICGRTGSGKSTLVSLLFRLLPGTSGTITIDNVDISTLPRQTVRSTIIAIPQEPLILSGSVRFNACPHLVDFSLPSTITTTTSPSEEDDEDSASSTSSTSNNHLVSDREIISALQKVKLWDYIAMRGGLSISVSSLGLSHGQKQLFCLARAILLKKKNPTTTTNNKKEKEKENKNKNTPHPKILILDEATSSVDIHTDATMRQIIATEFADFTVLTVAHRLSSLEECDRVVVMENGRIVEVGNPAELMERDERGGGGYWKRLWLAQH